MSKMILGQWYKTGQQAVSRVRELSKLHHGRQKYCIVCLREGFLVVGESALKNVGILPRRKHDKKLSPSGVLRRTDGSL